MSSDIHDWRLLLRHKLIVALILIALLFVVLLLYQLAQGRAVCRAPSVPVGQLDLGVERRFTRDEACATIGEDRIFHGVWVDTRDGGMFFPDATSVPSGRIPRATAWLSIDRTARDAVYRDLPAVDGLLGFQAIAISFFGTEYVFDRPTRDGLKRLFDVHDVRSIRLLRRDYLSARAAPAA